MDTRKQIIAVGGATAVSLASKNRRENPHQTVQEWVAPLTPDDFKIEQYILAQTGKEKPKICFLATASGDHPAIYDAYYEVMKKFNCEPSHVSLFSGTGPDLRSPIIGQDVIYVHGGNTRNLLTLWKDWGVDSLMREAYEQGTILSGWSAGSICWFEEGVTDSIPGSLTSLKCLGILKGSNCPHYDGEAERRPSYHQLLLEGKISGGVAADDRVALHYINGNLEHVFSNSIDGKAYSVRSDEQSGIKTVKETEWSRLLP